MRFKVPGGRWVPAFVAGVAVSGGAAVAISAGTGEINGCVAASGHLRVVTSGSCLPGESALSWNQKGPAGPQGPAGPAGPPGPPGGPGGGSATGPTLSSYATEEPFSSSAQELWETVPGSDFTLAVPADALVAVGGRVTSRLGRGDCDGALAEAAVRDADTGEWLAELTFDLLFPPLPGPATTALTKRRAQLRATTSLGDPPSGGGATTSGSSDPVEFTRDGWLGQYREMDPGTRHAVIQQYVYGMRNDGADCTPILETSHRKVWTSVFPTSTPGS